MGCLGKLGGCFGKTMMVGIIAVGIIVVIAALIPDDESTSPDTNTNNPSIATTMARSANQPDSDSQSSSSAAAADFTVVSQELIESPNMRNRWVVRIQMDASESDESKALGIVEAVRQAEDSRGAATIHIVFAYSGTDVELVADIGRGYTSDDGLGMAGTGDGLITDDEEGTIQVEVNGEVHTFDK